jgi:pimeloyl-ACP methyl ester carboxylesterase
MGEATRLRVTDEPYGGSAQAAWRGIDFGVHQRQTVLGGKVLNYVDIGAGDVPVVLVHGHGSTWQYWLEVMALLIRAHRRVIAVDLPGFGASQAHSFSTVSMSTTVDTLLALLDELGVSRCDLIGHSFGTIVGVEIAAADPDRIRSLTLAGGPASSIVAMFARPLHTALRRPRLVLTVLGDMFTAGLPLPSWIRRVVAQRRWLRRLAFGSYVARPARLAPDLAEELMRGVGAPGYFQIPLKGRQFAPAPFEAIGCPVLLVNGDHDAFVPATDVDEFLARVPAANGYVLEGAGHLVTVEYPATFVGLFGRFSASAEGSPAASVAEAR